MLKIITLIGTIFSSILFLIDTSLVNLKKEKIVNKIYRFPEEILVKSIYFYESEDNSKLIPYINKNIFEETVNSYLFTIYTNNELYSIEYNYFLIEDDQILLDVGAYKKNCEITIIFNISIFYKYTFYKTFKVVEK